MKHVYTPLAFGLLISLLGLPLCAQIKTDGSVGPAAQTLSGPGYVIPQSLGRLAGNNLLHSFQTFNVNTGEWASFTTSTAGIANVISRVTGGSVSNINGVLMLRPQGGGSPGFFFINPAGVTFGAGAVVDVPGALHISTANYLKFPDGEFHADLQKTSTFSSAPPEAFGFLGSSRASINIQNGAMLFTQVPATLGLTAGDITIDNAYVLSVGGGAMRVAAVGDAVQNVALSADAATAFGHLRINNNASITSMTKTALPGGAIHVQAGAITLDAGDALSMGITTDNRGTGAAGDIDVRTAGPLVLLGNAGIGSIALGAGHAGNIHIQADSLTLDGRNGASPSIDSTAKPMQGAPGRIDIAVAKSLVLRNGGTIATDNQSSAAGGGITVNAGDISLASDVKDYLSRISSQTLEGQGGDVTVTASSNITLGQLGIISADTSSAVNAGGAVRVHANGNIALDGGSISSHSNGSGHGGAVWVSANGAMTLRNGGSIGADALQNGAGGSVRVDAATMEIAGEGSLLSASTFASGMAGDIALTLTGDLVLRDRGGIWSVSSSSGTGGSIAVKAASVTLQNGGMVEASGFDRGNAGSIHIEAGRMNLVGGADKPAVIEVSAYGASGNAGDLTLHIANDLKLANGAIIGSVTGGAGNGGSIEIDAKNIILDGQDSRYSTTISSVAGKDSSGQAGAIAIAADTAVLRHAQITTSVAGSNGNGGDIHLVGRALVLDGGFIQANTVARDAKGGDVRIDTQVLAPSGSSLLLGGATPYRFTPEWFGFNVIQAAAPTGLSGTIEATAPVLDLSATLAGLGAHALDSGGLGRDPCHIGGASTLARGGYGGFAPLASDLPGPKRAHP